MYKAVKKLALSVIPKGILVRNEVFFRSLFAQGYKGNNHTCTICNHSLKKFIVLDDGDLLCPFCGSRARTRRLYNLLKEENLLKGNVLHFSPSRSLYRLLNKHPDIAYTSTDFEDEFVAEYQYDITNIPCPDNNFDLIICYHILEHIDEDEKAISELFRVLKPGGVCLVQTPFMEGDDVYEDFSITTEAGRLEAFGQADHVRVYSVNGLLNRLKKNGFTDCSPKNFSAAIKAGLTPETVIILKKHVS